MNDLKVYFNEAAMMIREIKERKNEINKTEIDEFFIEEFEKRLSELKELDAKQNTLRIRYQLKTAQVDEKIDELNLFINKARKYIKPEAKFKEWNNLGFPNENKK